MKLSLPISSKLMTACALLISAMILSGCAVTKYVCKDEGPGCYAAVPAVIAAGAAKSAVGLDGARKKTKGESIGTRYYRIKADYSVKDTGEKIEFDYVVVCGATVFSSIHTTSSVEYSYFPHQMIIPTSTGEAVGLRSLFMCADWTWGIDPRTGEPDGRDPIPDDLMTFAMWYPDVDNLVFAFGYESDLAYESPYARLAFHGASVEQVTHDDWKAWRETSKTEWEAEYGTEPVGGLPGPWGMGYSMHGGDREQQRLLASRNQKREPAGAVCLQMNALDLVEPQRSEVISLIPEGQDFIAIDAFQRSKEIYGDELIFKPAPLYNDGRFSAHVASQQHELGVRRSGGAPRKSRSGTSIVSNGGGRVNTSSKNGNFYHDIYPRLTREVFNVDPDTLEPEYVVDRILVTNEWNGFSFCQSDYVSVPSEDIQSYVEGKRDQVGIIYRPTPRRDARALNPRIGTHALPPGDLSGVERRMFVNSKQLRQGRVFELFGRNGRVYIAASR